MLSFWEKKDFTSYDLIVIGAGITGLSTAAVMAEKYPNQRILVLERGIFPTGASTKNAGFACFGSLSEIVSDLKKMSEKEVIDLIQLRYQGLQKLQYRLGGEAIGLQKYGGYELLLDAELPYLEHIHQVNDLLCPLFREDVFREVNSKIQAFGFNTNSVKKLLFNPFEAQIDMGRMMNALLDYVSAKGVRVLTGCEVEDLEDTGRKVYLRVKNPLMKHDLWLSASKTAICTNAFAKKLIPDIEMEAGRGQVLITAPIENLKIKGTFHFQEGFYYFRNFGNRILFGGGRNLDLEGENTTELTTTDKILNDLKDKLQHLILPNQPFEITDTWAGIMAFGKSKSPIIQRHSENIVIGVRAGGMGIAIGSEIGEKLVELISE